MSLKGISPLVATIMLIAFTLIIAGIISAFVVNFTETQQTQIKSCVDARVLLQRAAYDSTNRTLSLTIYNYGKVDLKIQAILTYPSTNPQPFLVSNSTKDVRAGGIEILKIENVTSDLDTVKVQSTKCERPCTECPGAQDSLRYPDISGMR
jgi:flagellin-like protein